MIEIALTISIVLLIVAVVVCIIFKRQNTQLQSEHLATQTELESAKAHNAELITHNEVLQQTHEHDQQRLDEFKKQIDEKFKAMAGDALKDSRDEFLKQANEKLKPVQEALTRLHEAEKLRKQDHGSLTEQLRQLNADQQTLRQETGNLVKALRRPEVRGRWGELQMKRLFDLAGLAERVDYDEQASIDAKDGGKLRPDFTIHLPNDRIIVVDVKTSLDAYLDATAASNDAEREDHLKRHASNVRTAAKGLAAKSYWENCQETPDFVVMFLPAESMLYAAVRHDPDLLEWAMESNVVISTPTIMIALLKTIAMGWREEQITENARVIGEQAAVMHSALCAFAGDYAKVRHHLIQAGQSYSDSASKFNNSVRRAVEKLEELNAKSTKSLPDDDEDNLDGRKSDRTLAPMIANLKSPTAFNTAQADEQPDTQE